MQVRAVIGALLVVLAACTSQERPVLAVDYTAWVSPELRGQLDLWFARLASAKGMRLEIRLRYANEGNANERTTDSSAATVVVDAVDSAAGSTLSLGMPELAALNRVDSPADDTCMVLADAPTVLVSTAPIGQAHGQPRGAHALLRMPGGLLGGAEAFTYAAPTYTSWRIVRIRIARTHGRLRSKCNASEARRLIDAAGIASIPANLLINRSAPDWNNRREVMQ